MQRKLNDLKRILIIVTIVEAFLLLFMWRGLSYDVLAAIVILAVQVLLYFYVTDHVEHVFEEQNAGVKEVMGDAASQAFLFGEVGMVIYDDEHVITWMSELFDRRGINRVGRKVLSWMPEAEALLNGNSDAVEVQLDDRLYKVFRKEDEPVLFFKDVTDLTRVQTAYDNGRVVLGSATFDNYEESTQYEDDSVVSAINAAIRTPFTEYCKEHGILVKRVNNSKYIMFLNEKIFQDLAADHFSILNTIRRAAQKQEVSITLSMSFARGDAKYEELDELNGSLMDLIQSRGGDQVAVQKVGEDVKYFGGSSEATEKRSRVRVRVMAHALRELMSRSSNVIVVGHKNMDFDCLGSAVAMAKIAQALHKQVSIVQKTGGVEEKLEAAMKKNAEALNSEVHFVTESEALNQLQDRTLVVMVDHHSKKQSNGFKVLDNAKYIAIVDHHRRAADMGVKPALVYIEPGASSACELVTELLPYISNRIEISELDATFMLTGMTIDTGRFHVRTGARTFDAASALRKLGADPAKADEYLKDSYSEFALKAAIASKSERHEHGVIVTPYNDQILTRSLMSQVADELLQIQDVNAVFVVADDADGETCISARSNGNVNVQVIMEAMSGGGHMTAAAMQRAHTNVESVKNELLTVMENYFKEAENESNPVE